MADSTRCGNSTRTVVAPCAYYASMCSLRAYTVFLRWCSLRACGPLTVCRLYDAMPPNPNPTPNPNPNPNPNPPTVCRLYDAMPPSLKAPWDASKSEVRCLGLADPDPNPNPNSHSHPTPTPTPNPNQASVRVVPFLVANQVRSK